MGIGVLGAYILCTVGVSMLFTHRLVGPTVAFRKHLIAIESGDFCHRTVLRKNDAFQEVAVQLNDLSAMLETKDKDRQRLGSGFWGKRPRILRKASSGRA